MIPHAYLWLFAFALLLGGTIQRLNHPFLAHCIKRRQRSLIFSLAYGYLRCVERLCGFILTTLDRRPNLCHGIFGSLVYFFVYLIVRVLHGRIIGPRAFSCLAKLEKQ